MEMWKKSHVYLFLAYFQKEHYIRLLVIFIICLNLIGTCQME